MPAFVANASLILTDAAQYKTSAVAAVETAVLRLSSKSE